jgi:hypothetical protein
MISPSSLSAFSVPPSPGYGTRAGAPSGTRQYARGPDGTPAAPQAPLKPPQQQAAPPGGGGPAPRVLPRGSLVDLSA